MKYRLEILNHWKIQESLLQSYRSQFLTIQSVLIGLTTIVFNLTDPRKEITLILIVFGLYTCRYWYEITKYRGLDVLYFQMKLLQSEMNINDSKLMSSFKSWQKKSVDSKEKDLKAYSLLGSVTRNILGSKMPKIFAILWCLLLCLWFNLYILH